MKNVPLYNFGNSGLIPNFEIAVFNSEEDLPEKCRENTIAVISGQPLNGWTFSDTEPENVENGHIWIKTGAGSFMGFNAAKQNAMWVYPVSCSQREDGTFIKRDMRIWQNEAWQGKILYLYRTGDTCDAVTGGWVAKARGTSSPAKAPVITETDNGMKVTLNATINGQKGCVQPDLPIDVSGFKKLFFHVYSLSENGTVTLGVTADTEKSVFEFAASSRAAKGDVEIDVSEVTGPCSIVIQCGNGSGENTISVTIDDVRLE